ncbi:MAG TPA: hypothetical protein VM260_20515 [Pirellula sp.]|nr:hypothetical protein [Pirellula sp.]
MLYEQPLSSRQSPNRFVLFFAFALSTLAVFEKTTWGQELSKTTFPEMSSLFDSDVDNIPLDERPKSLKLELPDSLADVPLPVSADERQELSSWVQWLVLRNLPPNFEDNRKWGKEKEIFYGIQFRREGWKIETKRKTKSAKHGTWSRYYIEFVEPAQKLQVTIQRIEFPIKGPIRVVTQITAPLKLFGRMSEWCRDVQLVSISANADATIELNVSCDIQVIINPLKIPPDVEFRPTVNDATVLLRDFEVHRISQLHGPIAELLGKGIRELLDNRLEDYREKLVVKMNSEIAKQKGKLKLSLQDWMQTSVRKKTE